MVESGFIKLHRKLIKKPIWKRSTAEQKAILVTLLLMANWRRDEWEWGCEKFTVEPGQFVTSIRSIVEACGKGIKTQNVRTALVRFEKLQFLTNQSTKYGRLISIINWDSYQVETESPNKQTNKDLTKGSQTPNKPLTPNEEYLRKIKKDKNINPPFPPWIDPDLFRDFIEFRKKIKKPMTDRAVKLAINKLEKFKNDGMDPNEIIENSIVNGWQGLFPSKNKSDNPSFGKHTEHNIKAGLDWLERYGDE